MGYPFRRKINGSRQRGFTLLEMVVVMILAALIGGILFQALGQVFRLQRHFGAEMNRMRQNAMLSDWFRQVIQGLQPDYEDGKHKFQATNRRITGLTINPLTPEQGVLAPFVLELRFDNASGETQLRYGEDKNAQVLLAWPGDEGGFVFIDAEQNEHAAWPPPMASKNVQLPASIRLEGRREGELWILVATPMGPDKPLPRLRDLVRKTF